MMMVTSNKCKWCYVEISSAIFGQLCFGILLVWKNIHFTYGHVCKCCEFANVIENTYQLTNLWKKQRSFFIIGIYDWWHRWNGVVFSTHRMNKFLNKRNFLCNSDGIIDHARSPGSLRVPQQTRLLRYTLPKNFF